ncbi:hypothetical protein BJ944DRAFT_250726 [Cunninghamella echinulata]|nr:hypothetical protein BJ944DRAFT_250726 [Cunninghamella echinulata]
MSPAQKKNKKQDNRDKKKAPKVNVKDKDEKQLEALLFGDLNGYDIWNDETTDLDPTLNDMSNSKESNEEEEEEEEPAFFFDSGPIKSESKQDRDSDIDQDEIDGGSDNDSSNDDDDSDEDEEMDEKEERYQQKSAWKDDDDALLQVSLTNTNRLKKLRKHEDEDIVSGVEYERRLRNQ